MIATREARRCTRTRGVVVSTGAELDGMASMVPGYGEGAIRGQGRRAVILIACLIVTIMSPAYAAPLRLLVLGDSLTAGYGLARADGFQARLTKALGARASELFAAPPQVQKVEVLANTPFKG